LARDWQTRVAGNEFIHEGTMDFKRRWRWLLAAGAVSVGCGKAPIDEPEPVQQEASLTQFGGNNACQDLERYLEDTAVMQMRTQIEASRDQVPSWGWWGGRGGFFGVEDARAGGVPTAAPSQGAPAPMPMNYTTTNNQVAGVDEADFVKNDGNRIFALSGNTLYMARSWPAADLSLQGKITIEGYPREMFLDGTDKAVVFSSIYQWYPLSNAAGASCDSLNCGFYNANTVKVTVLDVSNLSQPRVSKEFYLPGHYNSARKIGTSVRLVLSDDFNLPPNMRWWPEQTVFAPNGRPDAAAFDKLIVENERLIRQQTLGDWVPAATVKENGQSLAVPHPCGDFARVNAPTRLGTVSVATLNVATGGITRTSIIAEPGEIYASQQNLYVATRHWWWWPRPGQRDTTYLHKFDISNPDAARYVASGTVDGHIVDQFSLDESASGHLRVATTIASRVADPMNPNNWWGRLETVSRVTVLGQQGRRLAVTGKSEDLAPGERVMSSRFVGDKGFVVTFRQVDPLFTFDLSDPTNPVKLGELKIPGFSSYMHPIDANHLLTIGTYQPEPGPSGQVDWRSRALQLAIFDVSDMRNPKQTHVQLVGTSSSYSEAQHEHKAFNYFAAKKLLAIPFIDWSYNARSSTEYWSSFVSDLRVYDVDVQRGFTPKGAVSMADLYRRYSYDNWYYYYTPSVRRSVMADDFVYAISDSGLRVAHIGNLSAPIATVPFDRYVQR
jgi:hypothetical protein